MIFLFDFKHLTLVCATFAAWFRILGNTPHLRCLTTLPGPTSVEGMKNFLLSHTAQARYNRGMALAVALILLGFVLGATPQYFNGISLLAIFSGLTGLAVALNATKVAESASKAF